MRTITLSLLFAIPFVVACGPQGNGPGPKAHKACVVSEGGPAPEAGKITAGCYKVCRPSDADAEHEDPNAERVTGPHLRANDRLEVGEIGAGGADAWIFEDADGQAVTDDLKMSGNDKELRGFKEFKHKKNGADVGVTHEVRITRVEAGQEVSGCRPGGNVLKVQFCVVKSDALGNSNIVCDDQEHDLGHAHVEN